MNDQVIVRSAEEYFHEFGEKGIGKGADKWMVRRQLIDAFQKEMFGLIAMRTKKDPGIIPENDPEALRIAKNVVKDTTKKWLKLCRIFSCYVETRGLLKPDDLKVNLGEEDNT